MTGRLRQRSASAAVVAVLTASSGCAGSASIAAGVGPSAPPPATLLRCTQATAPQRRLPHASARLLSLPAQPFGIAATSGFSFVTLGGFASTASLGVFDDRGRVPRLLHRIPLGPSGEAGEALTPDGRYLLVADGTGAIVVDVARAEGGSAHAVLGGLSLPGVPARAARAASAVEVSTSRDGRFAFVSLEVQGGVAVYDLREALRSRFRRSGFVGTIRLGHFVVGTAVSPDGRWLYATSELAAGPIDPTRPGTLSAIDLRKAETDPVHSVVATADAGCQPVRVAVSPDGRDVWVTARASDALLAFSATELRRAPRRALLCAARVGEAPVGLALLDGGREALVCNSNRFGAAGAVADLALVDTRKLLAGEPALLGTLRAGRFPRELAVEPGSSTVLVTNFDSSQLEVVDLDGAAR